MWPCSTGEIGGDLTANSACCILCGFVSSGLWHHVPFFLFSLDRLLPWRKIGPLGCEQVLWCLTSGSSCSTVSEHGQASQALRAALSLGAVALHSSCSLLSRGAVGILGDQRMVLKIKKKNQTPKTRGEKCWEKGSPAEICILDLGTGLGKWYLIWTCAVIDLIFHALLYCFKLRRKAEWCSFILVAVELF